ncbi:MAG: hypothetical protein Q7S83_00440 [bacterium]|nr:hypothetical protein [bacterium]
MNQKIKDRLRANKLEYYDATDDKVAVIQKPTLEKIRKDERHLGLKIGSWWGSLALGSSLLFSLATTENFGAFMGIGGSAWQAIFFIGLAIAIMAFITLSVALAPRLLRFLTGKDNSDEDTIFIEKNRINGKKEEK